MDRNYRLLPARFSTLEAQRICLIKPSSLGDVVQSLPVLAALRARFPRAHIAWVANRPYVPLLRPIPQLDDVIEFDRAGFGRAWGGWRAFGEFLVRLRARGFDLTIDLQGLLRSGWMALATGASCRIGLASAREGSRWCYTDLVEDRAAGPAALVRYWSVVEALGVGRLPKEFPLGLTDDERGWAADRLKELPRPILAVHAGARWPTKRWPAEHFAQAAEAAVRPRGGSVVLVGAPEELEISAQVERCLKVPARNLCGQTTLRQLASLLEGTDALLTNDSGPMHMAAAVGTPTVSIFTCTDPRRAAPIGSEHRFVQTGVACRASYLRSCRSLACMKELTVDKVLPVLGDCILSSSTNDRRAA